MEDPCRKLLDQLKDGSQDEINYTFEELQCLLGAEIRQFVAYHFYHRGEVFIEELLQQVWIKVWLKADQCRGQTHIAIRAWIKQIALRMGINMVRDGQRLEELIRISQENDVEEDKNSICDENELIGQESWGTVTSNWRPTEDQVIFHDLMQHWLKRLTNQEGKVFILFLDGYPKSEIAEIMKISRSRVSQYIDQILAKNTGVNW
jgi:RNA polymerase sigma factor (sigma-70 family)